MRAIVIGSMILAAATGYAHGQQAGQCIQISARTEGSTNFYNVRNACPSKVIVYYVATHKAAGDTGSGNAHIEGGETHETYLPVTGGIETYACLFPHVPRNSDGETPHKPTNGYTCN